jgi:hypothetical protein
MPIEYCQKRNPSWLPSGTIPPLRATLAKVPTPKDLTGFQSFAGFVRKSILSRTCYPPPLPKPNVIDPKFYSALQRSIFEFFESTPTPNTSQGTFLARPALRGESNLYRYPTENKPISASLMACLSGSQSPRRHPLSSPKKGIEKRNQTARPIHILGNAPRCRSRQECGLPHRYQHAGWLHWTRSFLPYSGCNA